MERVTDLVARKTKDGPSLIDCHVGLRLRSRRNVLGHSQKELGAMVGLTFQQIQKYEQGANRIGSGRLFEFSHMLSVPVSYFFDEMPKELQTYTQRGAQEGVPLKKHILDAGIMNTRETIDLVRTFYSIKDDIVRQRFVELMREAARVSS